MIKCKSKTEFELKKIKYFLLFGDIITNERKRIIYLPEDPIWKEMFLNRKVKKNVQQ